MKVTCSKCGTEYNFDDAKVTEEGVKVKCTRCENVFRVRKKHFVLTEPVGEPGGVVPPSPAPEEPSQPSQPSISGTRQWMIRKTSGDVLEFTEMTTLQRWIVERQVGREDEISHNGLKWKRLGAIPELLPFFAVIEGGEKTTIQEPATANGGPAISLTDAVERAASTRKSEPAKKRGGRGAVLFSLLVLVAIAAAGAWAELTPAGRAASAPARAWLLAKTGLDLTEGGVTPAAATPTPTEVAAATTAPAPVSPIATDTPAPSPAASATQVAVSTPVKPTPTAKPHGVNVDQLLQEGYEAYTHQRYREAIQKYQSAIEADEENSEAYALLGLAYLDSGNDDLAESSLEASIRINPRFADSHRYLGQLYAKHGDKQSAIKEYNAYLDLRPNGPTSDDVRKRVASLQGG